MSEITEGRMHRGGTRIRVIMRSFGCPLSMDMPRRGTCYQGMRGRGKVKMKWEEVRRDKGMKGEENWYLICHTWFRVSYIAIILSHDFGLPILSQWQNIAINFIIYAVENTIPLNLELLKQGSEVLSLKKNETIFGIIDSINE